MKVKTKRQLKLRQFTPLMLMTVPGVLYLILNNYIPMFGIIIAFKNIDYAKGILRSDWIGFKNFEFLFKTQDALIITRNTVLYNVAFIMIMLISSVTIAILLNEVRIKKLARLYQSVVLLPYLISMVIVGYLVFSVLSLETGMMNRSILPALGIPEIKWYSEPKYWPLILTVVNIWKNTGYLCVIYYAAIIGIDREMYEAADIDGANKWQQVFTITLPMLKQVINIGIYFTLNAVTVFLMRIFLGRLIIRLGTARLVFSALGFLTVSMVLLAVAGSIPIFILAAILNGLGYGALHPVFNTMAVRACSPDRKGAANATFYIGIDVGAGVGSVIGGFLADQINYVAPFLAAAVFSIFAILVFGLLILRQIRRNPLMDLARPVSSNS